MLTVMDAASSVMLSSVISYGATADHIFCMLSPPWLLHGVIPTPARSNCVQHLHQHQQRTSSTTHATEQHMYISMCRFTHRALLDVLELRLEELGVSRLLVQPRQEWVNMFEHLGFEVLHPADTAVLHRQLPLAYTDAAVMNKALSPRW